MVGSSSLAIPRYLAKIGLLALAYYITGRLGLLLAVPPGYATAVWPPSGVVLAGLLCLGLRYWPGVLVGSFSVNLFLSFDPTDSDSMLLSGAIALVIASGATLQAVGGAWLVRRFVQIPNPLEQMRDIGLVVFLGGPVSCLINATISVTTLAVAGAMPWQNYGLNWLTWWVGDSIGVIVFTPILMLILSPRLSVSGARKLIVAAALNVIFSLAVYVFFTASTLEQRNQRISFDREAKDIGDKMEAELQNYLEVLLSVDRFYAASDVVDRREFHIFVDKLFPEYPGLQALSWNPKVARSERTAFEEETRRGGLPGFAIQERDIQGHMIPATLRDFSFPVTYVEPAGLNGKALGYDTYSETKRKIAMDQARDTGEAVATPRVSLVQGGDSYAFLLFRPIYKNHAPVTTVEERRVALEGYATAVFKFPAMLHDINALAGRKGLSLILEDRSASANTDLLYDSRTANHREGAAVSAEKPGILRWQKIIQLPGHQWSLTLEPTKDYLANNHTWTVWVVLTGGLLFTGLFGIFLLLITGRTDVVQRIVEEKTKEQKKLSAIIEESSDFVGMADLEGNLLYHNRSAMRMVGADDSESLSGMQIADMHPAWALTRILEEGLPTAAEKGVWQGESALLHRDGREIPVLQNISIHRNAEGEPLYSTTIMRDISSRIESENALKMSEEAFRSAMDHAPIGMALVSIDGKWLKVNGALCNLLGYSVEELMATDFQTLTHPEDLAKDLEQVAQMLRGEIETYRIEKRYFHKDGTTVWVMLHVSLMRDEENRPRHFISQIQDITAAKQDALQRQLAEDELRLSEERLHLATSGTSDGLWDWNLGSNELYYSPRFMHELGYEENELDYNIETFRRLLHPDDIEPTFRAVQAAHDDIAPYNTEYRLRHKDGSYIWCNARGQVVWDEQKVPVRMTGFTTNIDKRKHAERASKRAHDELNLIFNHVSARIWFKDDKNTILRLNTAAAEAMQGSVEQFENQSTSDLFPDQAAKYLADDLAVIESGKPLLNIVELHAPKNVVASWVSTDKIPYQDETLGRRGVLVVSRDITDLKRAEEQREQLVEKLTESNTELERFAYVASHDMQEPLRMIANFAALLESEYAARLDAEGRQYVGMVTDSAIRMQHMVNDLLEYARIGNDATRFSRVEATLELKHVLDNLSAAIRDRDAEVTFDPLPVIKANAVQFIRLLQNLIGNGLKYQAENTTPKVHVGVEDDGANWRFSVSDNGIGMPGQYATAIFEPYKRLHTWDEYKGTGIGLAVCKKIVENHQGKIWVVSELGKGSIFYFTLPKIKQEEL